MLKFLGSQVTHGVYRLALVFALPLLLVACGGGGGGGAGESPTPTPASITAQPVDRSAVAGSAVSFNVVARNAVSYQWQQTETAADNAPWRDILGATEASYTTPATTVAMSGLRFRVLVRGASGLQVISTAAALTVSATLEPPLILAHPQGQLVVVGQTASFSVTASGSALSYLWQTSADGGARWADLAERSLPTITWATTAPEADRRFRVVVSNSLATMVSEPATLTVSAAPGAPTFVRQPQALVEVIAGMSAVFNVEVAAAPTPTMQWQRSRDGGVSFQDIPGATARDLPLLSVTIADDGTRVRVVASNVNGSAISLVGVLRVGASTAPAVTITPTEQTVGVGQPVRIAADVLTGVPTPTLQWQVARAGSDAFVTFSGYTGPTLSLPFITPADSGVRLRLVATNAAGSATSAPAVVRFGTAPTALVSPEIPALQPGATWRFSASVSGTPSPAVQWQRAAAGSELFADIEGATALSYMTPPLLAADNGSRYRVVALNAVASVVSAPVQLRVARFPQVSFLSGGLELVNGSTAPLTATLNDTLPLEQVTWSVREASGGAYTLIEGATSLVYTPPAASGTSRIFKVEVRNAFGRATAEIFVKWRAPLAPVFLPYTSRAGTAVVGGTIELDAQPWFTFEAPALSWTWEESADGGTTWTRITGSDGPVLTLTNVTRALDGRTVRVVVSNSTGSTTAAASLGVATRAVAPTAAHIVRGTANAVVLKSGDTVALNRPFSSLPIGATPAMGVPMPSLRRQWSRDGGASWRDFAAGDRFHGPTAVQASDEGLLVREVASNAAGTATSHPVRVRVTDYPYDLWISWPSDVEVPEGAAARFEVGTVYIYAAFNNQYWQVSRDDGASWARVNAAIEWGEDYLVTLPVGTADNGLLYRQAMEIGGTTHFTGPARLTVRSATAAALEPWVGSAGGRGFLDGSVGVSRLLAPKQMLPSRSGGIYVVDDAALASAAYLRRLDPSGRLETENFPPIRPIEAVAEGADSTLYLADRQQIWSRSPAGTLAQIAGDAVGAGVSAAGFLRISGLAWLADGSLVVTEGGSRNCVRKVGADRVVRLLAGACGSPAGTADGIAAEARFDSPRAPVVDAAGNIYVVEPPTGLLRRIERDGRVSSRRVTINACAGSVCTEAPVVTYDLAIAADGRLHVATDRGVVLVNWATAGAGELLAGSPAPAAAVAVAPSGVLVATGLVGSGMIVAGGFGTRQDGGAAIWQRVGTGWSLVAGSESQAGTVDGVGAGAKFMLPTALRTDGRGGLIVVDQHAFTVRRVDAAGTVSTLAGQAGSPGSADGVGMSAKFTGPSALTVAADGTMFVGDRVDDGFFLSFVLRRISASGTVTRVALRPDAAGPAGGSLSSISALVALPDGALLMRDREGVRRVSSDGVVSRMFWETTLTGTGIWGCANLPGPMALAAAGDLYIGCGHLLLRVSPQGGVSAWGLKNGTRQGDGTAARAGFSYISDLTFDGSGRLLIADAGAQSIRRLDLDGTLSTVLGHDARARLVSRGFVIGNLAIENGGVVFGDRPRLNAALSIAWLGGNRFAIASEQGVHVATIP